MESTCAEWCRSHYWQLQERRGWRYAYHESVMVRYYEEANLDPSLLEPLVEFLKGDGWQGSYTVHNKPVDATGWKTRDVWYETRDGDVKEATKLKRTRIYHAVYKEGDAQGAGDGPYVVDDGCAWKVSHTFHWRVGELPTVPQGTSGVQYRMQGVTRDDETGLWSCVIEKRERVQQDVPCYASAETTFEKRFEEQHLGVKQENVQGTGQQASAGGGVRVRRQLRKNEDCTTDVVNETVQEKPVAGAVVETRKYVDGVTVTTVNRGQQEGASAAGLGVGESVRNEKTEGGLVDQTIVTTGADPVGKVGEECEHNALVHTHATTQGVGKTAPQTMEVTAAAGTTARKRMRITERGAWEVTDETRTAKPKIEVKTWTDVERSATRTVTYSNKLVVFRNQETLPPFDGFESVSPSVGINEFGLLDGVLRMRSLVSDVNTGSGTATAGGTRTGNTEYAEKYYQKKDGKLYKRTYTLTYDMCWGGSEAWLAAQKAQRQAKNFPELGCISGMHGDIMYIYTSVSVGAETAVGGEATSGSGS